MGAPAAVIRDSAAVRIHDQNPARCLVCQGAGSGPLGRRRCYAEDRSEALPQRERPPQCPRRCRCQRSSSLRRAQRDALAATAAGPRQVRHIPSSHPRLVPRRSGRAEHRSAMVAHTAVGSVLVAQPGCSCPGWRRRSRRPFLVMCAEVELTMTVVVAGWRGTRRGWRCGRASSNHGHACRRPGRWRWRVLTTPRGRSQQR